MAQPTAREMLLSHLDSLRLCTQVLRSPLAIHPKASVALRDAILGAQRIHQLYPLLDDLGDTTCP